MQKKIVIVLAAWAIIFTIIGAYIVLRIESSKTTLNRLITLHKVELLREGYLVHVKDVQSDLLQRSGNRSGSARPVGVHAQEIGRMLDGCYGCHHSRDVTARLDDLKRHTDEYRAALGRVAAILPGSGRPPVEEAAAFRIGEELGDRVSSMIDTTRMNLEKRTRNSLDEISRTKNVLYLLMGFAPLLGGLAVYGALTSLTRPINVLLESTRKLKRGDLDHRVEGLSDEFGELAASFNEMAESLKEQMRRMEEAQGKLSKANRELKLAQEQMVRAETMAALGTLSSGISHELSAPLSVILNMAELIKQDVADNPSLARDLEVIEDEASQAISITRSLLGFAKSAKSKAESVDVNEVLEDLFRILEIQPRARSIRLVKDLDPGLAPIRAGAVPMRQVFLNVILNSVQAMPDGGELKVATRNFPADRPEGIHVSIADTGSGIPDEHRKKIFQPFFTTKEEGTGLGLAICHGIVQEHNGRIEVESGAGKGTTFHIFLPRDGEPKGAI